MDALWAQLGGLFALVGFIALAAASLWRRAPGWSVSYTAALVGTALWLCAETLWGWSDPVTGLAESVRNLGWLWFMAAIAGRRAASGRLSAVGWIYVILFVLNLFIGLLSWFSAGDTALWIAIMVALPPAKMLFVAGALVLLHNLYDSARSDERRALSLPIAAMAAMWAYDLNLYAIAYLAREPASLMEMVRPAAAQVLVLILAMAALRPGAQAVRLSRPVAFRSLALAGIAAWLCLLAAAATIATSAGYEFSWRAQAGVLLLGVLGSALMLVSARARATMKVWVAKHFFEHRYDYRAEWLRFTATLHDQRTGHSPLATRVIQAIADIVEAQGGGLIAEDDAGRMTLSGGSAGALVDVSMDADVGTLAHYLAQTDRIVQFDEVRAGTGPAEERAAIPDWLLACDDLWVAVPLLHQHSVRGIVLLTRPAVDRSLDWEDFDLLRVAGRQAASYLAEARGSEALIESRRFEEFHRRFAFVMHDVKNLASQLGLLARNIERHGENPEFREDMTATVKLAAERLQSLTARLAEQDRVRVQHVTTIDSSSIARRVAASKRAAHSVEVDGDATALAAGDADLLERLLGHLVQNAIDASPVGVPVHVHVHSEGQSVRIDVADQGTGMSAEFVRTSLFRPFVSTKDGGFGIGAFQARQFAEAMGGTLAVSSREGEGTRFTLTLPVGTTHFDQEAA